MSKSHTQHKIAKEMRKSPNSKGEIHIAQQREEIEGNCDKLWDRRHVCRCQSTLQGAP